jgi:hypothetical protein
MAGGIKISHNRKLFAAIIILFIFIVFLEFIIKIKEKQEITECKVDSDCIKQQTTCCSCNMGGREECMDKKEAGVWKNKLGECGEVLCIALYNCKNTGCRCVGGNCTEEGS